MRSAEALAAPARSRNTLRVLLVLWFALYCTFALVSPPLLDDADSVHAEVAREMLLRRDPVTLYANGIRYLEKAPLLYWSMAAGLRTFGVHAAAVRLPLALWTLLLLLTVEHFARKAFVSARAGLYAALILLSSFGIFIFTRILIPDSMVCLWLVAALWCFWQTELADSTQPGAAPLLPCLGAGAACAMNILTKGLIGVVFPVVTVAGYMMLTRGLRGTLRRLFQLRPLAAAAAFLVIAAPWHVAVALANPTEGHPPGLHHAGRLLPWFWRGWSVGSPSFGNVHGWAWFYFVNEHLLRYLDLRVPRDYDTVPLLLFWGLLFVWLMPWSAFLLNALAAVPWRRAMRERLRHRSIYIELSREEHLLLLLGIAAVVPLLFFSFSTRQEYYVLPALPFLAMLVARWLDREATEAEVMAAPAPLHRAGMRAGGALLSLGALFAGAAAMLLLATRPVAEPVDLSSLLHSNPGDYALSFGHFLDLNARAMALFRLPLAISGSALLLSTLMAWRLRASYRPHMANQVLTGGALLFLMAAHIGLTTFSSVLTSAPHAAAIRAQMRPGELVCIDGEYEAGSSLGFYLQRSDIHILHGHSANLWYGSFFTDAPPIFETTLSLRARWDSPQRVYLWTSVDAPPALSHPFVVWSGSGKQILSNQANHSTAIEAAAAGHP